MVKKAFLSVLLAMPGALAAQEGRIAFSRSVQYDFELPEGMPEEMRERIPGARVSELLLFFTPTESVMVEAASPEPQAEGQDRRTAGFAARMRRNSTSRSDQEELIASHVNLTDGSMTEARTFLGRTFRITSERPTYAWSLGGEQREFLGYVVQKATAEHEGRSIEAWFTMQIPVSGGPGPYGGLPGMILLVSVDEGHTLYAASDVNLDGLAGYEIRPPESGDEVSWAEYEMIVEEKLAELELNQSRGDRRRPF
ncbi:MAG: GLPGLI family protein [Gemmatimonadota bacterium]|nr:GLPGLI family protein [Gemmatimonadota bacterium]